ncbi:MAG: hypothetical protein AAFP19_25985, partial [Bacteroidota bacterium]
MLLTSLILATFTSCTLPLFLGMLGAWLLGMLTWHAWSRQRYDQKIKSKDQQLTALQTDLNRSLQSNANVSADYSNLKSNFAQ